MTPTPFLLRFCHLFDLSRVCEDSWETYDKLCYYLLGNYLKPAYLIEMVELKYCINYSNSLCLKCREVLVGCIGSSTEPGIQHSERQQGNVCI